MVRRKLWLRLLRITVLCAVLVAAWYGLSYQRDTWYFFWRKNAVVRDVRALDDALRSTGLPMHELGRVAYGQAALPIWVLRQEAVNPHAPTVCLLGGVHGNEPAGTQALLSLAQDLSKAPPVLAKYSFVLVPLVNPWGWARDLRHNGDNRDVARQFVSGSAQEAGLVKALLQTERCALLVDLHEDRFHDGFYLLAYAPAQTDRLDSLITRIEQASGVQHAPHAPQGMYRVPQAEFSSIRLTTASLWARMQGVPNSFIVETPDRLPMASRVAVHRAAIRELLGLLK